MDLLVEYVTDIFDFLELQCGFHTGSFLAEVLYQYFYDACLCGGQFVTFSLPKTNMNSG